MKYFHHSYFLSITFDTLHGPKYPNQDMTYDTLICAKNMNILFTIIIKISSKKYIQSKFVQSHHMQVNKKHNVEDKTDNVLLRNMCIKVNPIYTNKKEQYF